jgi:hypothetical protein
LHVPHLDVVDAVGNQDLPEHIPKIHVFRKRRALRMSSWQVLLDLDIIFLGGLLLEQFLESSNIWFLISSNPLSLPGTGLTT